MTPSENELQKIPSEHSDYLGMSPCIFLHLLFTGGKKFNFSKEMSLLKILSLGFIPTVLRREKKKKGRNKPLKLIVAFSAVTVNILWMDTSEQRIQKKIPYNYLSNALRKDLDFATSP